jgi:TRAP transporter TAXI family solute receptor
MSKQLPVTAVEFMKVWGVLTGLVALGFIATYQYVGAPPPSVIRIATGAKDGAYYAFAQHYARLLEADGIDVEVVPTAGSGENLELLKRGDVTLALVQGGIASEEDRGQLRALGSLFLEPLWVFTREQTAIERLSELRSARLAVGAIGSGTNLLATQLLSANGVAQSNATLIHAGPSEAGRLLDQGAVDAVLVVASPSAQFVRDLLGRPGIKLFPFDRAAAYSRAFPFLTSAVLNEGVLNLARNIPPRDTTVVAVAAMLAARPDVNPGLIPALLNAVTRVHRPGGVLEQPRQFPSVDFTDLPMNDDAARYITEGPSFLYRWLPYGTAVRLDRLKLLALPLVALLIPLFRVAPPLYTWRIRSRIYRWYAQVRDVDLMLQNETIAARKDAAGRLKRLDREVASVSVPLAYTGELYHLRLHIRMMQERLDATSASAARSPRVNTASSELTTSGSQRAAP